MSNGNANYSRIQAHGTSSAFEPGYISQAGSVGPYLRPQESPFNLINANVNLVNASANDKIVVGDALAPGCVLTQVTLNGNNTLQQGVEVEFGFSELNPVTGSYGAFSSVSVIPGAAEVPGVPGSDINGGQVFFPAVTVSAPATGYVWVPALNVNTPADPIKKGSVNVTAVYVCP